ncbi:MAG: DNA mismatch repair endonuclease MutL [Oscillospiraceae bacterium]|nr:DNA mismatch repair endonuclease MutL [Oscillospiraceae bacterium]
MINCLDKSVAELIAAGEVVERPASVAKELIENAIDAGAGQIVVEVKNGGMTFLRVTDNGCGFFPEDVPLAFLRHATSKVRDAGDLDAIRTMGFRGEALASVAAVAKVELLTRRRGQTMGTRYRIEGGEERENAEAGCPEGSTVLVRELFYNTPARLKFLKKDTSESNAVANAVEKIALAYPGIAFQFIRDGERRLSTPGDGKLLSAVYAVYGREFAAGLIPVDYEMNGYRVQGYISCTHAARANRSMQTFYVNRRYIKSRTCTAALEEGYKHALMVGKFPACVLDLTVSPELVDVNVHPAKIEVRFQNEKNIFDLIYFGVRSALSAQDGPVEAKLPQAAPAKSFAAPAAPVQQSISAREYRERFAGETSEKTPGLSTKIAAPAASRSAILSGGEGLSFSEARQPYLSGAEAPSVVLRKKIDIEVEEPPKPPLRPGSFEGPKRQPAGEEFPQERQAAPEPSSSGQQPAGGLPPREAPGEMPPKGLFREPRYIGEVFHTYILLEDGDSLIAVDKHAAHERVLYNRLKSGAGREYCQQLLVPVSAALSKEEYDAALTHRELLARCGFETEDFGGSLLIRTAPMWVESGEAALVVSEICGSLCEGKADVTPEKLDWLYHNIACRSAVKGGDSSSREELEEIVRLLREDPEIRHCPHGRPVCIVFSRRDFEKQFGRA